MECIVRIMTHFLTTMIHPAKRALSCRSKSPGSNGTRIVVKEGQKILKKMVAGRRYLREDVWPTRELVFSWNSDGQDVNDWASSVVDTCSAPGWWQWSNCKGHGWRMEGEIKEKKMRVIE